MKCIPKVRVAKMRDRLRLQREVRVLTELPQNSFVQRAVSVFESKTTLFFVANFLAGGDIFYHLTLRGKMGEFGFAEPEARTLLSEVTAGLEHLHANNFIHRDIKVRRSFEANIHRPDHGIKALTRACLLPSRPRQRRRMWFLTAKGAQRSSTSG